MKIKIIIVMAVILGITACVKNKPKTNNEKLETLTINKIFQEDISDKYKNCIIKSDKGYLRKSSTYLVLPKKIKFNEPLDIKLYGCWRSQGSFISGTDVFKKIEIYHIDKNRVQLTVKKIDNTGGYAPSSMISFKKQYHKSIDKVWNRGELEIVVKNPNNKFLKAIVIVE
jgi:hypothetical protein